MMRTIQKLMIKILIKRLSKNISLPKYETSGSSGMDLSANIEEEIEMNKISFQFNNSIMYSISVSLNFDIVMGFEYI